MNSEFFENLGSVCNRTYNERMREQRSCVMKFTWIDLPGAFPCIGKKYNVVSDNVLVKLESGAYIKAFYHSGKKCWYNADNNKRLKETVVSWCLAY